MVWVERTWTVSNKRLELTFHVGTLLETIRDIKKEAYKSSIRNTHDQFLCFVDCVVLLSVCFCTDVCVCVMYM